MFCYQSHVLSLASLTHYFGYREFFSSVFSALSLSELLVWKFEALSSFFETKKKRKSIILEGCSWTFMKEVRPTQRHLHQVCFSGKPFAPSFTLDGANQFLRIMLLCDSIAWRLFLNWFLSFCLVYFLGWLFSDLCWFFFE